MRLAVQSAAQETDKARPLARILIVDDDEDFANSLAELLELQGFETSTANAPREALRRAEAFAPDIALIDVRLGRDSGLDLLSKLKASRPDMDALMLTAHASTDTAISAVRHAAYDYLRKPIDSGDLMVALGRCIEKRQLQRDKHVAEEALAQSEGRFRATFEQAAVGIALMTTDGQFVQVNEKLCDILGYKPSEMAHLSFRDVTNPDDLADTIILMKALIAGKSHEQALEKQCIRKDQATVWVSFTISLVRDAEGAPVNFVAVAEDVTERKRAVEALRASEQRLKSIVENVPGVVYRRLMRADGSVSFVYMGQRNVLLSTADPKEAMRDSNIMFDKLHPDDREAWHAAWTLSAKKLSRFDREIRIERTPGVYGWMRVSAVPHRLPNGDTLWDAIGYDATEEKQANEIRDRTFAALGNLSEGVALFGPDDRLIFANHRYVELNEEAGPFVKPGKTFEEILRVNLRLGRFLEAVGREETWMEKRLLAHRNLPYSVECQTTNMWHEVREGALPDGSVVVLITDITERKRAEAEAAEAHALLADAIEASPDAIGLSDVDDRLVLFNEAFKTGFLPGLSDLIEPGATVESLVRAAAERGLMAVPDGDIESYVRVRMEQYRAGNMNLEIELTNNRWILSRERRMPGGGIIGTSTDITDQKRAEIAIRESEERFRAVIDNSPMSFLLKDIEGRIQLANQTYLDWYGPTLTEMVGKRSHDLFPKETAEAMIAQDRVALETGEAFQREHQIVFKDGSIHSIVVTKFPILDGKGQPIGVAGISSDVTEQKQAEKAIRETEERFHAAIDHSPLAFVLKDVDGKIRLVNKSFLEWYDLSAEDIVGKFAHDIYDEELADALVAQDQEILSQGDVVERQHQAQFADGATHACVVTKFPVFDADRQIIGIGSITTDVTDQRKTEEQLRQAQKMEAVGQLTGGVAHDFNNLLTVILGNLDLLRDSVEDNSPARELIDAALKASERSAGLTQQLLAFSRKQTLTPKPTDIKERLAGIAGMMERTIGENIDIEINAANGLGRAMVDESQLESAILNLAINARDAMPDGGRVTISARGVSISKQQARENGHLNPGRYIAIDVADTGTGMSDDVTKHAVEPFFTTKEVGQGSGLGLSMVYGFVRQSGGDLKISSKVGQGTTIKLYLPEAKGDTKPSHGPRVAEQGSNTGKETVLIVEDEPQVRSFIVTVLERLGYNVLDAETGSRAIALVEKAPDIDLLITDLVLPGGMNGHEIAQQVKRLNARTRILYISGYSRGAVESGDPNSFLMKPFGRKALAETVRKALDAAND